MNTTQEHLSISDIRDDILLLKDGGGALVLQVSAVNFGLLSDREQVAIISAFAQMLNSLSFSIQIVIHSERLNISSYLKILDDAKKAQNNPLLSQMITGYRQFIQTTIKENEVLDKRFYIVIPLFALELGLTPSRESLEGKIKTILIPRRDQIVRQLGRVNLKAMHLTKQKLIEVFYYIYNGQVEEKPPGQIVNPQELAVKLKQPVRLADARSGPSAAQPTFNPAAQQPTSPIPPVTEPITTQGTKTHPFVVEELGE
ncbi:MAG: hypothetical protein PHE48_00400 [Candidatus Daviesbacteria bacterium]|nr:hypothetical protein [Candidatus Daviesbacteria bacterium]